MMANGDKRQNILSRLFEVLADLAPNIMHNVNELPVEKLPGIILCDGDEISSPSDRDKGRQSNAPNVITMRPEIWVILKDAKPENTAVGSDLNAYRITIMRAVLNDSELQTLVGQNGEIRYEGLINDLGRGQSMAGEMGMRITFNYDLHPSRI